MPITELIEKAGFKPNENYLGEVYGHKATDMLLIVEDEAVALVSKDHRILSTIASTDNYAILGALLHLTTNSDVTGIASEKIPYFFNIR